MPNRDLTPWSASRGLSPLGRDPFFSNFRREMDRLFDDFFAPAEARSFSPSATSGRVWPSVDVHETDQGYTVTAELPGLEREDVDISLHDDILTLRGEKRQERKEEDGGRTYAERSYGRFERSISLSAEVDVDKVEARFANGVLTINLPKNPQAKDSPRKIEIKPQA